MKTVSRPLLAPETVWDFRTDAASVVPSGEAVVTASPLPTIAVDPEGCVTLWNPAAETLFGWTAVEVLGRRNPIVPPEGRREVEALRRIVLHGRGFTGLERPRLRRDGTLLEASICTAPLRDGSRVAGVLTILTDVTRRKRAEHDLIRRNAGLETERQRLESLVRRAQTMASIGQLAAGVAHDFNNLLTVINGYATVLQRGLTAGDPMADGLAEIQKAGARAEGLTRQFLSLSRKQPVQVRVVDLNAVIGNINTMLARVIGADIKLVLDLDPALNAVRADPAQIDQILLNLVLNARDAMPAGGSLTIQTANSTRSGAQVMLAVTDTGHGMTEEVKARAFEPFFTTKQERGTGLGLANVHGIVKESGGQIEITSAPGQGTSFRIYLPRVEAVPETGNAAPTL